MNEAAPGPFGPVRPSTTSRGELRPAGRFRVEGGLWAERLEVNREVTVPLGPERLEEAGNLDNFRLAAGGGSGAYQGPLFSDSDVYKWLEAVAWEQGREPSAQLGGLQRSMTRLVASAQSPDGYLDTFYQCHPERSRLTELTFGHELYCAGHLFQAAVAARRATGDTELLEVSGRFASHLADVFGPEGRQGVPGHPEVEMALVELYREVGDPRFLRLASYFVDARGNRLLAPEHFDSPYFQDHLPVRKATTPEGHAVRALYLAAGAADVASETNDVDLLDALALQWGNMVASKTYLTGGLGSRWEGEAFGDPFELPPDLAYCETCAAIGSVMWSWRMLLATGNPSYADLIERTMLNAVLAGVSLDGTRFAYVNPLQVRSAGEQVSERSAGYGRRAWFGCACCPANVMRTLSSFEHYFATSSPRGVQLQQFAPGALAAPTPAGPVALAVRTDYPWDGEIEVEVLDAPSGRWELSIRAPGWCDNPSATLRDGSELELSGGYLRAERAWSAGDRVGVRLPMPPRRTRADRRVDAVRGCAALERGPLVYCFEGTDLPPGADLDRIVSADGPITTTQLPWLSAGAVGLRVAARFPDPDPGLYRPSTVEPLTGGGTEVHLGTVPYFAWGNRELGPMRVWVPEA
ncbi:MAG: glycoside hydrolase family 127 protein [Actinomycetota bacterium]|nr:glycoside hydrolase family 127 protein [Actinomycetota bacterium]